MNIPFAVDPRRPTTDIVVELSYSQTPTLPFELKDYVSPNTWEARVPALVRLASRYCRPTFERAYVIFILVLTFLVPTATYYITIQVLENTTTDIEKQLWFVRFSCVAVTVAMWIVLSAPIIIWKYLGKIRVMRLVGLWTRTDALSAASYGTAPVWRASSPWLFSDTIVLTVTVPLTRKSHFDRDSCLPPYVSAAGDVLPLYGNSKIQWSKGPMGGIKYGDLPIYTNDKINLA